MALSEQSESYRRIWEAALRSAAGPLSSYLTPEFYGLSVHSISALPDQNDEISFSDEITARLDIGRAAQLADILENIDNPTTVYRHQVEISAGLVRGKIHMPRLLARRARGDLLNVPVLRAAQHMTTPENLLVSEAITWSLDIRRRWVAKGGAEGAFSKTLLLRIQSIERTQPWASLRDKPREPLLRLANLVIGRSKSGINPVDGTFNKIADMVLGRNAGASLEASAGPLSYLSVNDGRFEDRLFELLCVGWLIKSLTKVLDSYSVFPKSIKGSNDPILIGYKNNNKVELFYQAGYMSKKARWSRRNNSKKIGAIPDISIEIQSNSDRRTIIIDAKNRSRGSEGEVIYKMLGYMENLGLDPYRAVGIFPAFVEASSLTIVEREQHRVALMRANLETGARAIHALVRGVSV